MAEAQRATHPTQRLRGRGDGGGLPLVVGRQYADAVRERGVQRVH
eukprot:CAMPEP_0196701960 /NCGR_PEP_ID=MMETSP1090-20130531/52676_1 /TAXON_ID=37098 /ORGANISM="Isochrysis sp, Strain CCMP1244" /LENGTH=44 /DNA_ID= /DNA_START= /DNA_END= /DNA_ORIENTATION=